MNFLGRFVREASAKRVLVSFVLFVAVAVLINGRFAGTAGLVEITGGPALLDMEVHGYSAERAYELLGSLGGQGRAFYLRRIAPVDVFFPPVYALFFASLMAFLLKKLSRGGVPAPWAYLVFLPPLLAMSYDWIENAGIAAMLMRYPDVLPKAVVIASRATVAKFLMFGTSVAVCCLLLAALAVSRLRGRVTA